MTNENENAFDSWCVVEVMGHRRLAGRVTEVQIAGAGFLRVDVPDTEGEDGARAFTQLLSPNSIYAITPVTEEVARELARLTVEPVAHWDVKRLLPHEPEQHEVYYEPERYEEPDIEPYPGEVGDESYDAYEEETS